MKKNAYTFFISSTIILVLFACSPQLEQVSPTTTKIIGISRTPTESPLVETLTSIDSETMLANTQESLSFPLAESGPYFAGNRVYTFVDGSRHGREIEVKIYYPSLKESDEQGGTITRDAAPDMSGAPYPIIMTGKNSGNYLFKSHLASYGFVMVIVYSPGFSYEAPWNNSVIDAPLDFLFVLDSLSSNHPEGLDGVLDTNRIGVAGYSSDGLFSLALGGARVNQEYYLSSCALAPSMDPPLSQFLIDYYCSLSERWNEFSLQVGMEITKGSNGLWQPTTDSRILAVMPMAPDSAWLYGEEGLAAVKIPSLIVAGTADVDVSYKMTSCYVYKYLVNSDRILISFIGKGHMMVEQTEVIRRIDHFAVAFFGYYLQGRKDFAQYYSEEFVSQFNDLAWGIYD